MQIEKLGRLKEQAEAKLTNEIGAILLRFEQETGIYPDGVYLQFTRVQNLGKRDQNMLTSVELEIKV